MARVGNYVRARVPEPLGPDRRPAAPGAESRFTGCSKPGSRSSWCPSTLMVF